MKLLLIGAGSIGRRHLRNLRALRPTDQITVLRHRPSADVIDELKLADNVVYGNVGNLSDEFDAAIIASPAPSHLEAALQLAERGVHLLIEKPLADRLEGVDALISACQASRSTLLVGYTLRFMASLRAVHAAIQAGQIGRVLGIRIEVGQYLPDWRPQSDYRQVVSAQRRLGGGALLELSHEIDYCRWLMGEIESVQAFVNRSGTLEIDVEDQAALTVRMTNQSIGTIQLDMLQRTPVRGCRITGQQGTICWDGIADSASLFSVNDRQWQVLHAAGSSDRNAMYMNELVHFFDCIADRVEPLVSGHDGKRVLEVIAQARASSDAQVSSHISRAAA